MPGAGGHRAADSDLGPIAPSLLSHLGERVWANRMWTEMLLLRCGLTCFKSPAAATMLGLILNRY